MPSSVPIAPVRVSIAFRLLTPRAPPIGGLGSDCRSSESVGFQRYCAAAMLETGTATFTIGSNGAPAELRPEALAPKVRAWRILLSNPCLVVTTNRGSRIRDDLLESTGRTV